MTKKIAIIGGGNLGTAIAEGLLKSKFCKASDILITKRNTSTLQALEARAVRVTSDNALAVSKSDIVILAVKPYQVSEVSTVLGPYYLQSIYWYQWLPVC